MGEGYEPFPIHIHMDNTKINGFLFLEFPVQAALPRNFIFRTPLRSPYEIMPIKKKMED